MTYLRRLPAWFPPVALGVLLRLPLLGSRTLWYDEAFSVLLARRSFEAILSGTAADTMPPLYYLLLSGWMSFADSVAWIRLLNVLLGGALVALIYLLGRELNGARAAAWAGFLAAVSPLLIYHAQELRMYTLLGVGLVGHVYFALLARRLPAPRSRAWAWSASVGAGAVALYSHNLAVFSLLGLPVYFLVRRDWKSLLRLVLAGGAMIAIFAPWLIQVPAQVAKIQAAFWTPRPGILEVVQALVAFHSFLPLSGIWLSVAVGSAVLAAVLTGVVLIRLRPPGEAAGLLLTLVGVPVVALFAASYVMRPVFVPRAMMLSLAAYLLLGGLAIASARPRVVGAGIAAAFVAAAAVGLPAQFAHDTFPRSPFADAARFLQQSRSEPEVVLHDTKLSFFPMHFYAPELNQEFLADEPGSHNDTLAPATQAALGLFPISEAAEAARGAQRVRYVIFQRALDEYAARDERRPPALAWLESAGELRTRTAFGDLWIYDFDVDR